MSKTPPKKAPPAHSAPVRFTMDKRAFGVVQFPRAQGVSRINMKPVQSALEASLGVRVKAKRNWLFGRKHHSFVFMGQQVQVRLLGNGDACIDLHGIDDEVRETILEHMRTSLDFEGR